MKYTDHAALRALLAKATPLPWAQKYNGLGIWRKNGDARLLKNLVVPARYGLSDPAHWEQVRRNYAYIVAACNALPFLLEELRALEETK